MVEEAVVVQLPAGLFARPAALFVQAANRFRADIFIEKDGKAVNAKSIMGVMSLAIARGQSILLRADGEDEVDAVARLTKLVLNESV